MKRLVALVFLSLAVTGCGYKKWSKPVGAFSTSAAPALTQVSAAYTSANDVHLLVREAELVDQYTAKGYTPGEIQDFISPDSLKARQAAIGVLNSYASLVGDLALGKREQELATKTKAVSSSMSSAKTTTSSSSSKTKSLTTTQMGDILTTLDYAIKPLIEHKVRKHLPAILKAADPSIQQICTLLEQDIDTLRSQEQNDYQTQLMGQSQFIDKNTLSAVEKRTEITKLVQIEVDAAKADADLVKAKDALVKLAEAHHRLVTEKK